MTKLLITTGIYPPDIGGPATYSYHLTEEFEKIGSEIKIVAYGEGKANNNQQEVHFVSRQYNLFSRYFKYFCIVFNLSAKADLVYCLDLVSAGLPTILAAKLRGKKIVFRFGGDFLWEKAFQNGWTKKSLAEYYSSTKSIKEKLLFQFCFWLLKGADRIIFSSNLQAGIYLKYYRIPPHKVTIINNPIQRPQIFDTEAKKENRVIFAGRLIKLKNIPALIKAFSEVNVVDSKLLIFGEGPEEDNLRRVIRELKIEDRVIVNQPVNQNELIENLQRSKFFILPSFTEISPNIALECLSIFKPILITKENGLDPAVTAHLLAIDPFSINDMRAKIEFLLDDNNLKNYENELRRVVIEKNDWLDVAKKHLELFQNVIDNKKI
ncbi:MAG TPA: glycosyltransferase family 4 protein [bacterium]|nr:glycosyltransferase family 4 protein [bacterium]